MTQTLQALVRRTRSQEPGALESLLSHPRVKEIARVRAHKAMPFPWATVRERRTDCQRLTWEAVMAQKDARIDDLKNDGSWSAYLSTCVKYKLLRQIRGELGLREATVIANTGRKRFELQPKLVRAPFDLALAQIDALADPCWLVAKREGVLEIHEAVETASMSLGARRVLQLRLKGMMSKDIASLIGKTPSFVSQLLKEGRRAVRDQLYKIRTGHIGQPSGPDKGGPGVVQQIDLHHEVRKLMAKAA